MRVLAFGDSITYGAWDTEDGWVDRLKRDAHRQTVETDGEKKLQIINLGIGGDTGTKILKRMSADIAARYSASWEFFIMISFGTNDERTIDGKADVPIELFESNAREIIKIAKQHSSKILFVEVPPIGQPIVMFKGQEYSDERLKDYESRLRTIVEEEGLPFLPIRPAFEQTDMSNLYAYDHIHPNDNGHKLIADTVRPKLWEMLKGAD